MDIKEVMDEIGCKEQVAEELLILAHYDVDLVLDSYRLSKHLPETKARIVDARLASNNIF